MSLCMIMAVIALLVGRSQSLASLHLYWVWALLVHPTPINPKFCQMCPPYLPICGISPPLQVNCSCVTFKPSKLLNLFCVPVLAHEEVLSALLFLHVWWLHTLTSMHNVLVPNIAKRAGKRVPSPQKISYNNHIISISSHYGLEKSWT